MDRDGRPGGQRVLPGVRHVSRPGRHDLRAATCSNGAPSARNLLVTVFGDVLLPHGIRDGGVRARRWPISSESFGVNERLVRTSLTRLVNDGLLAVTERSGRRSFYGVAPDVAGAVPRRPTAHLPGRSARLGRVVDDRRDRRHRVHGGPSGPAATGARLGRSRGRRPERDGVTGGRSPTRLPRSSTGSVASRTCSSVDRGGRGREHDRRRGAGPALCALDEIGAEYGIFVDGFEPFDRSPPDARTGIGVQAPHVARGELSADRARRPATPGRTAARRLDRDRARAIAARSMGRWQRRRSRSGRDGRASPRLRGRRP